MGLTFISNSTLEGRWTGKDEKDEKKTQYKQEIPQIVALGLSIQGQCRGLTVCEGVPRAQGMCALQFQSRVAA